MKEEEGNKRERERETTKGRIRKTMEKVGRGRTELSFDRKRDKYQDRRGRANIRECSLR